MRIAVRVSATPTNVNGVLTADEFVHQARRVDDFGFDRVSVGDSQLRNMECFTSLSLLAATTKNVEIGPGITNPVTRDAGVMANMLASLDVMSGGRAYCLIGRGDGAVRNAGLKPATVQGMRRYFAAVRQLLDTGRAVLDGREIRLKWVTEYPRHVPLYLVAEGPRMLRMAGEVADGVFVGGGLLPDLVEQALEHISEGARSVGRDLADLDIWWDTRSGIGRTWEAAYQKARESIASAGNHALRAGFDGKLIPAALHDRLRQYHAAFDYSKKGEGTQNSIAMEEFGLTDYFVERFGVVGTPPDIVTRLRQLESIGVTQISMGVHDELFVESPDSIDLLGREVLPHVKAR